LDDIEDKWNLTAAAAVASEAVAARLAKPRSIDHDISSKCDKRRLEAVEWENSCLLHKLEVANDVVDKLEKQLLDKEEILQRKRHDIAALQRNFDFLATLVDDHATEKKRFQQELTSLKEERHANYASLNHQRELLHNDRLAFTLERIAFDNLREREVETTRVEIVHS